MSNLWLLSNHWCSKIAPVILRNKNHTSDSLEDKMTWRLRSLPSTMVDMLNSMKKLRWRRLLSRMPLPVNIKRRWLSSRLVYMMEQHLEVQISILHFLLSLTSTSRTWFSPRQHQELASKASLSLKLRHKMLLSPAEAHHKKQDVKLKLPEDLHQIHTPQSNWSCLSLNWPS